MTGSRESLRRHQTWEQFNHFLEDGHPVVVPIPGEPGAHLFAEPAGDRIGLRIKQEGDDIPASPLAEVLLKSVLYEHTRMLEVSTGRPELFRDFHAFACTVADRAQVDGLPAADAVLAALASWSRLLGRQEILGIERQLGLLGELWALERISRFASWPEALAAWRGTASEEHDFGLPAADVEVKSTLSERRVHVVSSLTQLHPVEPIPLHILSLQFTDAAAGSGYTLGDRVSELESGVRSDGQGAMQLFGQKLDAVGWRSEDAPYYRRRLRLRSTPVLVPVDARCPAVVPAVLQAMDPDLRARILRVQYSVDLTGLGVEDGAPEFLEVLPPGRTVL